MVELAEIFRQHGDDYRAKYGNRMPTSHRRAMQDIEQCRTEVMGGHLFHCPECDETIYSYHSCQNRHCPKCQHGAAQDWLERQRQLLLPAPYFLLTFTLPDALRSLARSHQKRIYHLLFQASAQATQELAKDPRFVGGQIGMVGVLQTWTRELVYHPHIHYLVPGGGITANGEWRRSKNHFFVHVRPLSLLFRAKFRDALRKTEFFSKIPSSVWHQEWVVHSQSVGNGLTALKYLAPYVFRIAISNRRILKLKDGLVTFEFTDSRSQQRRRCTLSAEEFMRRFLQHVLPRGLVKVRYFGLFAPANRHRLKQVRQLLAAEETADILPNGVIASSTDISAGGDSLCPQCGQPMTQRRLLRARTRCPP